MPPVLFSQVWNVSRPTKLLLNSLLGHCMINGTDFPLLVFPPINHNELFQAPIPSNSQPLSGFCLPMGTVPVFYHGWKVQPALLGTLPLASADPFRFISQLQPPPFHVLVILNCSISQTCHALTWLPVIFLSPSLCWRSVFFHPWISAQMPQGSLFWPPRPG